jgi:hypothetical protein
MEPESSLLRSQEPSTGPYQELDWSSPHRPIISKIHFNTASRFPGSATNNLWVLALTLYLLGICHVELQLIKTLQTLCINQVF